MAEFGFEEALAKEIADLIREHVAVAMKTLRDTIKALETSIAELQASGIRYVGGYQRAMPYRRGDVCTSDGSAWCAISEVAPNEQPGKSSNWQLMVCKGKDAKAAA